LELAKASSSLGIFSSDEILHNSGRKILNKLTGELKNGRTILEDRE